MPYADLNFTPPGTYRVEVPLNRSGIDASFMLETSPAGTSGCERSRPTRTHRVGRQHLKQRIQKLVAASQTRRPTPRRCRRHAPDHERQLRRSPTLDANTFRRNTFGCSVDGRRPATMTSTVPASPAPRTNRWTGPLRTSPPACAAQSLRSSLPHSAVTCTNRDSVSVQFTVWMYPSPSCAHTSVIGSIEPGLVVKSSSPTVGFRSRDSLRWTAQAPWNVSRPKA